MRPVWIHIDPDGVEHEHTNSTRAIMAMKRQGGTYEVRRREIEKAG